MGRIHKIRTALRLRTGLVLLVAHLGLILAILAMTRIQFSGLLVVGISCLYGGLLLGLGFLYRPIRHMREAVFWVERFQDELPAAMATVNRIRAAWLEGKRAATRKK